MILLVSLSFFNLQSVLATGPFDHITISRTPDPAKPKRVGIRSDSGIHVGPGPVANGHVVDKIMKDSKQVEDEYNALPKKIRKNDGLPMRNGIYADGKYNFTTQPKPAVPKGETFKNEVVASC